MNKFKRDVDQFIGEKPRFNETLKKKILMKVSEEHQPKRSLRQPFHAFHYALMLAVVLAGAAIFLVAILDPEPLQPETAASVPGKNEVLTDPDTAAEIQTFADVEKPLEVMDFKRDAMDRGNHEYTAYPLLVDPKAYGEKAVSRGDVVAYEHKYFDGLQMTVSRVIGLPGETVEVIEGQIYINEKKLDTFYGKAHRLGISSNEEYNASLKANGASQNMDSMKEIFSQSIPAVELEEDEVFLAGDDWFRSGHHILKTGEIYGEVLGYKK